MAYEDKLNTYDFFGYLIPGAVVLIPLSLMLYNNNNIIFQQPDNIPKLLYSIVFVILSYLTGHIIQIIGGILEDEFIDKYCTSIYKSKKYKISDSSNIKCLSYLVGSVITYIPYFVITTFLIPLILVYTVMSTFFRFCCSIKASNKSEYYMIYKGYYRIAIESKNKSYVERYVAHKGMYRGMAVAFYFLTFVLLVEFGPYYAIASAVLYHLSIYRYFSFREKLYKEVMIVTRNLRQ